MGRNSEPRQLRVFCSYAHEDAKFRKELRSSLLQFERQGIIATWDDRKISAGEDWDGKIKEELNRADVVIFLISQDFEASAYCWDVEVTRAFDRRAEGVQIIPIVVRAIHMKTSRFGELDARPKDENGDLLPIQNWPYPDDAYVAISETLWDIANKPSMSDGHDTSPEPENFWNVPKRTKELVGREALMRRIPDELAAAGERPVVALVADGGVGKTSVAVEFAWRHRSEYDLVAWLGAEEETSLNWEYSQLAHRVELAVTDSAAARSALRTWLSEHDRWLLIFDNASNVAVVRRLLPDTMRGHVLITSREQVWEDLGREVPVSVLNEDDAVDYVLRGTRTADRRAARELAILVGRVPRALEDAVATICAEGISVADYIRRLKAASQ